MKIGIIVYSKSNHTMSVAQKLRDAYLAEEHDVEILPITVKNEDPTTGGEIILDKTPDYKPFDFIVFGSPVWAFSLCPVMKQYLTTCDTFTDKTIYCFVTHHFPFAFLGGNRSVNTLKSLCQNKGALVSKTGVVSWSSKKREDQIDHIVKSFSIIEKE